MKTTKTPKYRDMLLSADGGHIYGFMKVLQLVIGSLITMITAKEVPLSLVGQDHGWEQHQACEFWSPRGGTNTGSTLS